nr:hypothetical protein CFP56_70480 [Quercus suber]
MPCTDDQSILTCVADGSYSLYIQECDHMVWQVLIFGRGGGFGADKPWFHQAVGNAVTVLDYSKIMEQLCREAYLLKKDQVIKLREVLEADKDGNFCIWEFKVFLCSQPANSLRNFLKTDKIKTGHYAKMTSNCFMDIFWSSASRQGLYFGPVCSVIKQSWLKKSFRQQYTLFLKSQLFDQPLCYSSMMDVCIHDGLISNTQQYIDLLDSRVHVHFRQFHKRLMKERQEGE